MKEFGTPKTANCFRYKELKKDTNLEKKTLIKLDGAHEINLTTQLHITYDSKNCN